jgi:hypothetical protein
MIIGVVFCLMGLLWMLQGADVAKGSGMTGHGEWIVFGGMLAAVGVYLILVDRRLRREAADPDS